MLSKVNKSCIDILDIHPGFFVERLLESETLIHNAMSRAKTTHGVTQFCFN